MAEPYLTNLKQMAGKWTEADARVGPLECRHFFSGAAAYRQGAIVATLTPIGLAFKVTTEIHDELLARGKAVPLRYFPNSFIKKDYVLFPQGFFSSGDAVQLIVGTSPFA